MALSIPEPVEFLGLVFQSSRLAAGARVPRMAVLALALATLLPLALPTRGAQIFANKYIEDLPG